MLAALHRERIVRAVLGGACGFLVAMALVAANMPLLPGGSVYAACVVAAALGVFVAVVVPALWIAVCAAILAVSLFMLTFTPLTAERIHAWIRRDPPSKSMPDAVVVLSTTISGDGLLDATGTTRLLSGLEVMRDTRARMLVTTRPSQTGDEPAQDPMKDYGRLIGLAGDTSRWRVVGPVASTRDEAVAVSRLLAPAGDHSIVVVTSPLHTRRACAAFEGVGFTVTCWPSDERRYAVNTFSGVRTRLAATVDWLYERAGMVEYHWRGWTR